MNVIRIDLYTAVQQLRVHWKEWDTVMRAEAVATLLQSPLSVATLARIAGCSKASIRRLHVIAQLPPELKARIRAGEPSGKFVAWARAERPSRVFGIAQTKCAATTASNKPRLFLVRSTAHYVAPRIPVSHDPEM